MKNRIAEIIKYAGISASAFSKIVGAKTSQAIYDILSGKTKTVSSDFLFKVKSAYPEISAEWLITGKGTMIDQDTKQNFISQSSSDILSPNLVNSTFTMGNFDNPELIISDLRRKLIEAQEKIIKLMEEK
ncbi:MAG: hypothetical protein K2G69_06050 [Muribaculaceae bacterium]|nr:hypothetical protein [Muribaculaceae bacterium]